MRLLSILWTFFLVRFLFLFFLFLFFLFRRRGYGVGNAFGIGAMPPLPLEVTHFVSLVGMFYLEHGVCVATYLPQNGFERAVDLVSPLHQRIHIGVLAWHFSHALLRREGHVCHFAQRFDLVLAPFVSFTFLKGKLSVPCTEGCPLYDAQIEKLERQIAPAHHVTTVLTCQQLRVGFF